MCLLIGAQGVGKTLLLKRLNHCSNKGSYNTVDEAPATVPTVGTNLVNIITSRRAEITVRELGGSMAPIWHNYYRECDSILFMVDMSNRTQISASSIQLMEVLKNPGLQHVPVLIILNKIDVTGAMDRHELNDINRLDSIIKHAKQDVTLLQVSAKDGTGLQPVAKWIQEHSRPNAAG